MKRLFGGIKTKSREVLADPADAAPASAQQQQQQQQPDAPPLPPSQSSPAFVPANSLQLPTAPGSAPSPAGSQPSTANAAGPKKRFGFGFGGKEQPASEHSNGEASADGYEQARVGWGAPNGLAPPQQQLQVFVDSRPPRVENVTGVIGWSCAHPTLDYPLILSLCDYVSLSAAAASDAARALRKEIKYAVPDAQERAVRLLGIMMRNSDLRFKQQVASKKFLTALGELATNKKTEPRVVEMILRVLSPLAYEYQRDAELSPITTLWKKLKPPSAPVNGAPLAADDPLFTPTADPRRTTRRASGRRAQGRFPSQAEHLADLRKEAMAAKGNAAMLHESVAFSPAEELASNELVAEFYTKCFASQQAIVSNLDWLTVQAEQARKGVAQNSLPAPTQPTSPSGVQFGSNNPFASKSDPPVLIKAEVETDEELTLAVLLSANSDIIDALALHDHRLRLFAASQRETDELAAVQERSLAETRFDRSTAGQPDAHGNYLHSPSPDTSHGEGTSRSPSPSRQPERRQEPKGKDNEKATRRISMNPYAAYLAPAALGGYEVPHVESPVEEEPPRGRSGSVDEMPPPPTKGIYDDVALLGESRAVRRQGTADSTIETPQAPSEKALGKLRRVSMRTDADPLEQQRQLEEKLRAKYSRNYEDDVRRRSDEIVRE